MRGSGLLGGEGGGVAGDLLDVSFTDSNILATFIMTPRFLAALSYREGDRWKETLLVPTGCRFKPGPGLCPAASPPELSSLSVVYSYLIILLLSHCPDSTAFTSPCQDLLIMVSFKFGRWTQRP